MSDNVRIIDAREHHAAQCAMREVAQRYLSDDRADLFALASELNAAAARAIRHVKESRDCVS